MPPAVATARAMAADTGISSRIRARAGSTPTAWAVRSPLARASRIGPHSTISTVSSNAAIVMTGTESQPARASDPRVQNMTERAVSGESEEKIMRLVRAWKPNPTPNPPRISCSGDWVRPAIARTSRVASNAPAKAITPTTVATEVPTMMMAKAAPEDAPALTPST